MARHRVAGGGDGLQIWMVAANILNKQSKTDDRGWSYSLGGLGEGLQLHTVKYELFRKWAFVNTVMGISVR